MGRYDLRLSDEQFWSATPREFGALLARHQAERQALDYRAGVIAAALYNVNGGIDHRAAQPGDFFALPRNQTRAPTKPELVAAAMAAVKRAQEA